MKKVRAWRDGQEIAPDINVANTFLKRLKGLMFEDGLQSGQGLLITPCNQVHTFGMKFTIDVVYLSKSGEVLHAQSGMAPGSVGPRIGGCRRILELENGAIRKRRIAPGQRIAFEPAARLAEIHLQEKKEGDA